MKTSGQTLPREGKRKSSSCLSKDQCAVLKMAYQRLAENEDLCFGEIAITLHGCKPDQIGPRKVRRLPVKDLLDFCRLAPHDDFQFSDPFSRKSFHLAMEAVSQLVAGLVEKRLLEIVPAGKLIWAKEEPRVERIEYCQMVRLTEPGRKVIA